MKICCFANAEDTGLTELPHGTHGQLDPSCAWVDVEAYEDAELVDWLKTLGFSREALRVCARKYSATHVSVFRDEVFFGMPALASDIGSERVALTFLCRPDLCITMHRQPVEGLARTAAHLTRETDHAYTDTSSLVGALMAGLSVRAVDAVDEIRMGVLGMMERMDRDPEQVEAEDIHGQGISVRTLDGVIGERSVVLDRLEKIQSPALDVSENRDFKAALSDTQYLDRAIERLEKRLADLRVRFAVNQQDRTNRRLTVLTVLSAIFLPLTLMAGIYGMNFQYMPELALRYAYPGLLALMALLAIGMVWYFRTRGWFD